MKEKPHIDSPAKNKMNESSVISTGSGGSGGSPMEVQWAEAEAALEALPANIALLDSQGVIVRVNSAWAAFSEGNGGNPGVTGVGADYLAVCDHAKGEDAAQAMQFAAGVRSVIRGERERFSMEYPCHAPDENRWFVGHAVVSKGGGPTRVVIAHVAVTEQKRTQELVRALNLELENRIQERTGELRSVVESLEKEIGRRQRLEREILKISEREQCRIGQDLHDGLGQDLAGISMIAGLLAGRLLTEYHPLAGDADEVARLTRSAIESTRQLAAGLYPVELENYGLIPVLENLANQTKRLFGVSCEFRETGGSPEAGEEVAIHIYRIVQEAVTNAVRHGMPDHIVIESCGGAGGHTFSITDDGVGLEIPEKSLGMGLRIMEYRARVIGATLRVEKPAKGGCRVSCRVPHVGGH